MLLHLRQDEVRCTVDDPAHGDDVVGGKTPAQQRHNGSARCDTPLEQHLYPGASRRRENLRPMPRHDRFVCGDHVFAQRYALEDVVQRRTLASHNLDDDAGVRMAYDRLRVGE